jgi:recombination protein RecA
LFGEGISRHGEIIDMGVNAQIIEKSGAWYAYQGEKIGQGRDNAREFLRENAGLSIEIENKVRESVGIPVLPGAVTPAVAEVPKTKASKKGEAA